MLATPLLSTQVLVGQRYGTRELPTTIPAVDFDRIRTALASRRSRDLKHAVALLDSCYELDENSPERDQVYLLTNRNFAPSLQSTDDPAVVSGPRLLVSTVRVRFLYFTVCCARRPLKSVMCSQMS